MHNRPRSLLEPTSCAKLLIRERVRTRMSVSYPPPVSHPCPFPTYGSSLEVPTECSANPWSSGSFESMSVAELCEWVRCCPPPSPAQTVSDVLASAHVAQRGHNMRGLLDHHVLGVLRVRPASHPSASRLKCVRVKSHSALPRPDTPRPPCACCSVLAAHAWPQMTINDFERLDSESSRGRLTRLAADLAR